MKDECQIVQDLLPLVKDDVASEASIVFVHNFLLLPIIGALGYWLLKRYVFLLYLMIPIMHLLLEMIDASYQEALLPYTLIYWFFMSIGILIYAGYAYALRRENS